MSKIIVLTPVKNDAWILRRFLSVTSVFADLIIITDQLSNDGSREIYKDYPKVVVIDNVSEEYNEAARQIQLIKKARELCPGKKIILTLDADEVLVANYHLTKSWKKMLEASVGTVLYFEKPDLQGSTSNAIRYKDLYPMGMVEDYPHDSSHYYLLRGFKSKGHKILDRDLKLNPIDLSAYASLNLEDPLFLHYAHTRLDIQSAKMRLYSVIEATLYGRSIKNILARRHKYNPKPDYSNLGKIEPSKTEWFADWEKIGIDMHSIEQQQGLYWRDIEILKYFKNYGSKYFEYEDIWDIDWEDLRKKAKKINTEGIPESAVYKPGLMLQSALRFTYSMYLLYRKVRKKL